MNIDQLLSLAFAMHETKGGYAFLIGSGVSRAAGIPTGWEVVLALISQVATLEGGTAPADPAAWYRERYGGEPDYSVLLEALAGTPAERRQLLRGYFEPTEEDRSAGLKVPTDAHRAIADLARRGHVRVVLTTNFDRLLEQAMEAAGVTPAVLSVADAIDGAMPLVHAPVTVVKLHGDYLDSRLRNTETELAAYEPKLDALLDRVLEEFGLVVCGWSATWDPALRRAIERCPSRRFTTWWAARGELTAEAAAVVAHRRARVVPIDSAERFFRQLSERVGALEDLSVPHPASPAVAVAMLKRYLVDPVHRIRLHDLLMEEVERVIALATTGAAMTPEPPGTRTYGDAAETIRTRVAALEASTATLLPMLATGCYWAAVDHEGLWVKAVERLSAAVPETSSTNWWTEMHRYPSLLALFTAALGAMAGDREEVAIRLLLAPRVPTYSGPAAAVKVLYPAKVLEMDAMRMVPGLEKRRTPSSDHLLAQMQSVIGPLLPDVKRVEGLFERFEYLLALTYLGLKAQDGHADWAPIGRFAWKSEDIWNYSLLKDIDAEAKQGGTDWLLLRLGLFGGSLEEFLKAQGEFGKLISRFRFS